MRHQSAPHGVSFQAVGKAGSGVWIVRIHTDADGVYGDSWSRAFVIERAGHRQCIGYALGKPPDDDTPILRASEAGRLLRALSWFGMSDFRWERIKDDLREERWIDLRRWRADA